jgi:hypothetical protein
MFEKHTWYSGIDRPNKLDIIEEFTIVMTSDYNAVFQMEFFFVRLSLIPEARSNIKRGNNICE